MEVTSPLTGNNHVRLIAKLDTGRIVEQYQTDLKMNVSFREKEISVYQCNESKLKFYHPLSLAGKEKFYEDLARGRKDYYSKWKWEYSTASDFISGNTSLLEIGCGNGYFLKEILKKNIKASGLEFNDYAIQNAMNQGLAVKKEPIQEHALSHINFYDYVCAFQVFEHVPDIKDILAASIKVLKPGGLLIFGVPNNDSYIFRENKYNTLNLPPHHILLWDQQSLTQLPALFPDIQLVKLLFEPESKIFRSMCYKIYLQKKIGKNRLATLTFKATRFIVKNLLADRVKFGYGPTVLAIYQKNVRT